MIKKIWNKLFSKESPEEAISFQQGFDLTGLPIITLTQGDTKLNFLLDTGSTSCIIEVDVARNLKCEPLEKYDYLTGAEGVTKVVQHCKIPLSYKDKDCTYKFLVNDLKTVFERIKQQHGVTLHGIIGSNFFNEYKYVLDFDEMIAYSKK